MDSYSSSLFPNSSPLLPSDKPSEETQFKKNQPLEEKLNVTTQEKFKEVINGLELPQRLEKARSLFKQNPRLIRFFNFLSIPEEQIRLSFALDLIKTHLLSIRFYEKDYFNLKDEQSELQIALAFAEQEAESLTAGFDRKFYLGDEKNRVTVAKLIASHHPQLAAANFKKFSIQNKQDKIEIAKILANKAPEELLKHFNQFAIQSEEEKRELAAILIETAPQLFARYFSKLEMTSLEEIKHLAFLLAQKSPEDFIRYFDNFGIEPEKERIQFIQDFIQNKKFNNLVLEHISNFNISDQEFLFDLFNNSIKKDPSLVRYIPLSLEPEERLDLFFENFGNSYDKSSISHYQLGDVPLSIFQWPNYTLQPHQFISRVQDEIYSFSSEIDYFAKNIEEPLDERQIDYLLWVSYALAYAKAYELEKSFITHKELWKEISAYRDSSMQKELTSLVFNNKEILQEPQEGSFYWELVSSNKGKPIRHMYLIGLFLQEIGQKGSAQEKQDILKLASLLKANRALRIADYQKIVLDTLSSLSKSSLSVADSVFVLEKAFEVTEKEKMKANFYIIYSLLSTHFTDKLTKEHLLHSSYEQLYQETLLELIPLSKENFVENYNKTFDQERMPESLLIYASKLEQLPNQEKNELLTCLATYMDQVLAGSFKKERYQSPHLDFIFEEEKDNPKLKSNWMEGGSLSFPETNLAAVDTDQFWDLFISATELQTCQRVDGDPNLNKCLLAYCVDGKNRLLAIKNKEGKIIARAIIRLLWDENSKSAVLFQEQTYVLNDSDTLSEKLLKQFAIERAKALGLNLYCEGHQSVQIVSQGSKAPYEYSDTRINQAIPKGKFVIDKALLLYQATLPQ